MSIGPTSVSETEVLSQRVLALQQHTRQLIDALDQVKRTRFLMILVLVLFAGITCFSFYRLVARFQEKEQMDALLEKAQKRLVERNDFIMKDVQALVDHSAPVLSKAFYEQSKKDLPAFLNAGQSERDKLVEDLKTKLTERLQKHHENLLERHEKLLREEFPSVKDEKLHVAMMGNLQLSVDELVKKYYIEELESEMKSLYATWDEFPASPQSEKGELPLEDQLVANLLELLKTKLAETAIPEVALNAPPAGAITPAAPMTTPPTAPAVTPPAAPEATPPAAPAASPPAAPEATPPAAPAATPPAAPEAAPPATPPAAPAVTSPEAPGEKPVPENPAAP